MILRNTDIATLLEGIRNSGGKLVCFGAGWQLREACDLFNEYGFFDRMDAIIDNRETVFTFKNSIKPCLPVEAVRTMAGIKTIYISSMYYPEMWEQLSGFEELASCDCYIHMFVMHTPLKYDFPRPEAGAARKIPKTIHYCWFGGGEIPQRNQEWMKSWAKYCPDYEVIRHDESNYDVAKNRYMREAYSAKKWAFVSDYARIDLIYEMGGIYLDTDVELLRGLDDLLYDDAFVGLSTMSDANNGLGFGATPGFRIIGEMRDYYDLFSFFKEDGNMNLINNSKYQTTILRKHGFVDGNRPQLLNGLRVYPTDVLSPMNNMGNRVAFTANTVSIHHYEASWMGGNFKAKRGIILEQYRNFELNHAIS